MARSKKKPPTFTPNPVAWGDVNGRRLALGDTVRRGEDLGDVRQLIEPHPGWFRALIGWPPDEIEPDVGDDDYPAGGTEQFVDTILLAWVSSEEEAPAPAAIEERDADGERTHCPTCGEELLFDPTVEGETVGGLMLAGWLVCQGFGCDGVWLTRRGVPSERFRLAKGGRSLDAGGTRLRAEGGGPHVERLMSRIARLPDLERALRQIAGGASNPAELALAALNPAKEGT